MKNNRGTCVYLLFLISGVFCLMLNSGLLAQEHQIQKAKIFEEFYQLISESDLYCSFFMYEEGKPLPDTRIIGAEREREKSMFSDGDTVYIDKGLADGVELGQLFLVVGMEEKVGNLGWVMERRCRAKVIRIEDHLATVRLERTCGGARIGDYLIPFEEQEGEIGKDRGYEDPCAGKIGRVVYINHGFNIAGTGQWAIVSLGRRQCVQIGDRITLFQRVRAGLPREPIGSAIVIDVRGGTSTIKILSCRNAVELGNEVQLIEAR